MKLGHKVIVITHSYDNRCGVRYITNGLKVYYCPLAPLVDQAIFPTLFGFFPLFRKILIKENIQIVHCHQTSSILGEECILHSRTMGLKTIYTDHSLFGFNDAACIHLNKILSFTISDIDHAISVSHTSKENLSLRARVNPYYIAVIPNAVDCTRFKPDPTKRYPLNTINIVSISRMTFRKGIDLLVDVIPVICKKFPEVYFILGGDGPKKKLLEETVEKYHLKDRVEFLGAIPHKEVRNVLVRGHIFLNTSLTEAFCIAIVEAASSGLLVVATNVGGVTEVLPSNMVYLAKPNAADIIDKLAQAIPQGKNVPTHQFHERVSKMYNWNNIAKRTEKVYEKAMKMPRVSLFERMQKIYSCGPFSGPIFIVIFVIDILLYSLLCLFQKSEDIDKALDFPYQRYNQHKEKFGDHKFSILQKQQVQKQNK